MSAPYYDADGITLYLGDCREQTAWLEADVLVTDPPYGVGYEDRTGRTVANDHDFTTALAALEMASAMPMAVFANHASLERTLTAVRRSHPRQRVMTWHKSNGPSFAGCLADVEFAVLGMDEWPKRPLSAVVSCPRHVGNPSWQTGNREAFLHPTQKPVKVMAAVLSAMPPGIVADPFAGSGSTLSAARMLGRKAVGVEIDESYCEVIATRLSQGDLFGDAPVPTNGHPDKCGGRVLCARCGGADGAYADHLDLDDDAA